SVGKSRKGVSAWGGLPRNKKEKDGGFIRLHALPRVLPRKADRAVLAAPAFVRRVAHRRADLVAAQRREQQHRQSPPALERQRAAMARRVVRSADGRTRSSGRGRG